MHTRVLTAAAISFTALAVLSACSSGSGGSDGGGASGGTLGIVQFSGDDVYSNSALAGAAAYAEEQGWETVTVDAKGSVDGANAAMTNLVTQGVDALVVSVFPSAALGAGIASAQEAGVPIANWGGGTGDGVIFAADTALGDDLAAKVVEDMGGEGDLLALGYNPGLPCQNRELALDAALESTDIEVAKQQITIPGATTSALAATQAWAAAHPPTDTPLAIWSCFDDPATGVVAGLIDLGRTDILSYGLNGTKEAIGLVKDGTLTATLWIDGPQQGADLAELLIAAVADPDAATETEIGGTTQVVDSSTVDAFIEAHPEFG